MITGLRKYEFVPLDSEARLLVGTLELASPVLASQSRLSVGRFIYLVGSQQSLNDVARASPGYLYAMLCTEAGFRNPSKGAVGWSIANQSAEEISMACEVFEHIASNRTVANFAWNDLVALFPPGRLIRQERVRLQCVPSISTVYGVLVAVSLKEVQRREIELPELLSAAIGEHRPQLTSHAWVGGNLGATYWWWSE